MNYGAVAKYAIIGLAGLALFGLAFLLAMIAQLIGANYRFARHEDGRSVLTSALLSVPTTLVMLAQRRILFRWRE